MSTITDPGQAVLVALRRIVRATDFSAKALAKETELTTSQLLVLQLLEPDRSLTVGEVAKHVNLNQATVTTIVDRLEERHLIKRHGEATLPHDTAHFPVKPINRFGNIIKR